MLRVGLTGGIASGKSVVAAELRRLQVPVIDADQLARDVVEPGRPALAAIVARFGEGVLEAEGRLDRKQLARMVFDDSGARTDLEKIIHPEVAREAAIRLRELAHQGEALAVYEVPLLVETGLLPFFDRVVVIAAKRATQIERVMRRDEITMAEAEARLAAQMSTEEKVQHAHHVIWNDSSYEELRVAVRRLHGDLLQLATRGQGE